MTASTARTPYAAAAQGALAALLLVVAGCGGDKKAAAPKAATAASAQVEIDPEVAAAQKSMVQAVTVGTRNAPVDLRFDLRAAPVQNQPFDVEFAVLPEATAVTLRASVTGQGGLLVTSPSEPVLLEKLSAGSVHRFSATAVSEHTGAQVIELQVAMDLPTGQSVRTFTVPVIVAPAPARGR